MYILGDLIKVEKDSDKIPLPWWHRAPLAFESETTVFVGLTNSSDNNRPGDLFVSVLDPNYLDKMYRLQIMYNDKPGVLETAFKHIADDDWNIALAETITIKSGNKHSLDLIIEPVSRKVEKEVDELLEGLRSNNFEILDCQKLSPLPEGIYWHEKAVVKNGWIDLDDDVLPWKKYIKKQLEELELSNFDYSKLVISADTEKRILFITLPKKGVLNIVIEHADDPGALEVITEALKKSSLNILSCLLKRGGVISGNAVLVAVCEPNKVDDSNNSDYIKNIIETNLINIPKKYRPKIKVDYGRRAISSIYNRHKDDIIIKVPEVLKARVLQVRNKFEKNKLRVFLSQRFLEGKPKRYSSEVKEALLDLDCQVIQANIQPGGINTSFSEVSASMWASNCGIVLVTNPDVEDEVSFSLNLAHEFGFLQGQNKPLLLLVENNLKVIKELDFFSNAKGITAPRFSPDAAFERTNNDSIYSQVKKWVLDIKLK